MQDSEAPVKLLCASQRCNTACRRDRGESDVHTCMTSTLESRLSKRTACTCLRRLEMSSGGVCEDGRLRSNLLCVVAVRASFPAIKHLCKNAWTTQRTEGRHTARLALKPDEHGDKDRFLHGYTSKLSRSMGLCAQHTSSVSLARATMDPALDQPCTVWYGPYHYLPLSDL